MIMNGINGEPTEFEWNIFPGFTTLQLCVKNNDLLSDLGQTPETFTRRISFMSIFNEKNSKDECLANAGVVTVLAKKFGIGQRSFIGPGSEKKCYSGEEKCPQGAWDHIADEMLLESAESGHPGHLSCRMCNQITFHHQFGIDTGRSKFEQETDSILSACGSHGQNPSGS